MPPILPAPRTATWEVDRSVVLGMDSRIAASRGWRLADGSVGLEDTPMGVVWGVVIDSKEVGWGGTVVPSGRVLIAGQMAHELE